MWKWGTEKFLTVNVIEKFWNIDYGFWKPRSAPQTGLSSQSRFTKHEKLLRKSLYKSSELDQIFTQNLPQKKETNLEVALLHRI